MFSRLPNQSRCPHEHEHELKRLGQPRSQLWCAGDFWVALCCRENPRRGGPGLDALLVPGLSIYVAEKRFDKGKGGPIVRTQSVVDHNELDGNGFVTVGVGYHSYEVNDFAAQIHSLELRAASRDSEALVRDDGTKGKEKYALRLESRELRRQARNLRNQRAQLMAARRGDAKDIVDFGGILTTE
jgi:hypothetical protein